MSEVMRKSTVACAIGLIVIGMCLSIAAILTPSWQVVNLQEYNSVHEHGLWLDCTRHVRDTHAILRRYATITEPLHCVYKFDYDKYSGTFDIEDDNSPVGEVNRHKFYGWHTATMILLTLALLTSMLSVCLAACGCCYASLSIVFTITTLLTSFLSNVAVGIFFFFSHRADNRFIKGIVATYEQRVGLAFFLQMAACAVHFIALGAAAVSTYFAFTVKGGALDRYSIQTTSKTNMTNVGRRQLKQIDEIEGDYYGSNQGGYDNDTVGFGNVPSFTPLLAIQAPHNNNQMGYDIGSAGMGSSYSNYNAEPPSRAASNVTVFDTAPRTSLMSYDSASMSCYEREPTRRAGFASPSVSAATARRGATLSSATPRASPGGATLVHEESELVERQRHYRAETSA